ncbi:hypothetical protein VII00023_03278 [Vibrio ichthyoenteri ATCC 700023]|uniref:Uncharacterized protein n=1 Tax=Vibrio ichthyoenteri ATCC 700023 TaxID=870968 RepID=F9RYM0_9VIBR|nr:hypothetical protein VII00023_03278 [Vibrio ichthyoenteri ATCC 700023]
MTVMCITLVKSNHAIEIKANEVAKASLLENFSQKNCWHELENATLIFESSRK